VEHGAATEVDEGGAASVVYGEEEDATGEDGDAGIVGGCLEG